MSVSSDCSASRPIIVRLIPRTQHAPTACAQGRLSRSGRAKGVSIPCVRILNVGLRSSNQGEFDLVQADLGAPAVVELGRTGRGVMGNRRRLFQRAPFLILARAVIAPYLIYQNFITCVTAY